MDLIVLSIFLQVVLLIWVTVLICHARAVENKLDALDLLLQQLPGSMETTKSTLTASQMAALNSARCAIPEGSLVNPFGRLASGSSRSATMARS